jgi:hypothetical protein
MIIAVTIGIHACDLNNATVKYKTISTYSIPPDTETNLTKSRTSRPNSFLWDAATETIVPNSMTHSSPLAFRQSAPVSLAASFPSVSSDGTKLGLERST